MLFSYAIVDFYLLHDVAVEMQIWALLTTGHSDTQVTITVCGSFVSLSTGMHPMQAEDLKEAPFQRW